MCEIILKKSITNPTIYIRVPAQCWLRLNNFYQYIYQYFISPTLDPIAIVAYKNNECA